MMNDFESLLSKRNKDSINSFDNVIREDIKKEDEDIKAPKQKSEKCASLFDFVKMVNALVRLTMDTSEFIPDERKIHALDVMKTIDKPIISYKVISRIPKMEIKPRIREEFIEVNPYTKEKLLGQVHGQKFECLIQFDIVGSVYTNAEEVMNNFEELMLKYTGFFKKNGVAELFFKKHLSDESFDNLRESYSVRSLVYYIEIEKLTVSFMNEIEEIELLAQKLLIKED